MPPPPLDPEFSYLLPEFFLCKPLDNNQNRVSGDVLDGIGEKERGGTETKEHSKTEGRDSDSDNSNTAVASAPKKKLISIWTPEEDEKLIAAMAKRGTKRWNDVAAEADFNRSGKQCRERWKNHLSGTNKEPFTAEEIAIMKDAFQKIGAKHVRISKMLPGRSENQVKNYYHSVYHDISKAKRRKSKKGIDSDENEGEEKGGDASEDAKSTKKTTKRKRETKKTDKRSTNGSLSDNVESNGNTTTMTTTAMTKKTNKKKKSRLHFDCLESDGSDYEPEKWKKDGNGNNIEDEDEDEEDED